MNKNQISKPKSNFDRTSQKLIVIFGFIAAIITMLWFAFLIFGNRISDRMLYDARHIQTTAIPFSITISALLIAKGISNIKHKQYLSSTIANMFCGIVILIVSVVYMSISYFIILDTASQFRAFRETMLRMVKYLLIFQSCIVWALCYNLMQLKNKGNQSIQSIKKNNAIFAIVLGCLIIPAYVIIFAAGFLDSTWKAPLQFARAFICAGYVLIALVMSLQILIICLTQKQNKKNKIILLSICIGFILAFYACTKGWHRTFFDKDVYYFILITGLATTSLCIPVFIKTK